MHYHVAGDETQDTLMHDEIHIKHVVVNKYTHTNRNIHNIKCGLALLLGEFAHRLSNVK